MWGRKELVIRNDMYDMQSLLLLNLTVRVKKCVGKVYWMSLFALRWRWLRLGPMP